MGRCKLEIPNSKQELFVLDQGPKVRSQVPRNKWECFHGLQKTLEEDGEAKVNRAITSGCNKQKEVHSLPEKYGLCNSEGRI